MPIQSEKHTGEVENPLEEFQAILKEALHFLHYPDEVFEFLKKPMRFLEVSIPVRMDDGTTKGISRVSCSA